jgi:hypothetical protein
MTNKARTPLEEIWAIREKISRKYKTMDEYLDHLKTVPSADVLLAQVRAKNEKLKVRATPKAEKRPASRRRKAVAHA